MEDKQLHFICRVWKKLSLKSKHAIISRTIACFVAELEPRKRDRVIKRIDQLLDEQASR